MKKEEIRREFFKLKIKGHTNNQCRKIILAQFGYEVCKRTLQRWNYKLNKGNWDLCDKSKRPARIHYKITPEIEGSILSIRNKTGWGEDKISNFVEVGHSSINKILNKNNLTKPIPIEKRG